MKAYSPEFKLQHPFKEREKKVRCVGLFVIETLVRQTQEIFRQPSQTDMLQVKIERSCLKIKNKTKR